MELQYEPHITKGTTALVVAETIDATKNVKAICGAAELFASCGLSFSNKEKSRRGMERGIYSASTKITVWCSAPAGGSRIEAE